jgi:hypothetical protein
MDDIVLRAMQKWPDVPRAFGWLRLDRRGDWWIRGGLPGAFERIGNRAVIDFIGRNYAADERGRWFFQNGPQRVFVALDYTPWVYRLEPGGRGWTAHTGREAVIDALHVDEAGSLLGRGPLGIGVVDDRDLPAVVGALQAENRFIADEQSLLDIAGGARPAGLRLFGRDITLCAVHSRELAASFGFDPAPAAEPGEPEC